MAMWRQDGQQLHGLNAAGAARRMTRATDGRVEKSLQSRGERPWNFFACIDAGSDRPSSACGCCPAPRARKFPRVRPRVSAGARIDRKKCPHRKAPCPSRRFLAARRVWQRSVRGRCNPGSGVWCLIYQTLDQSEKTTTHVHRRSGSPYTSRGLNLLARPNGTCPGSGAGLSQREFPAGARTQETSWFCDVMKTEPFGKPTVRMYQFGWYWVAVRTDPVQVPG